MHGRIGWLIYLILSMPFESRAAQGRELWRFRTGAGILSSPALGADGSVYCGADDGNFYAVSRNGISRWVFPAGEVINASPVIDADGTLYVGSTTGRFYALHPDGTIKWTVTTSGTPMSAALSAEGTLYLGTPQGDFYAFGSDGGNRWQVETGGNSFSAPSIARDGTIYFGSADGSIYALTAEGHERWRFKTGSFGSGCRNPIQALLSSNTILKNMKRCGFLGIGLVSGLWIVCGGTLAETQTLLSRRQTTVPVFSKAEQTTPATVKPTAKETVEIPPPKRRHPLLDYNFTNELGQSVSLGQFHGQALGITFFFTRCPVPDYCPRLSKNFQEASQKMLSMPGTPTNWHFLSVSIDTEFDTPLVLKAYAKKYRYDPKHWSFLTGPSDRIAELAKLSDTSFEREGGLYNHNFRTLIIDATGRLQMAFPIGGNLSDAIVEEMLKAAAVKNR